jgi:hypothetical protein
MDVALNYLGIVRNTHGSRVLTGSLLGSTAVFYVLPALIELLQTLFNIPAKPAAQKLNLPPEQVAAAQSDYSAPYRRI